MEATYRTSVISHTLLSFFAECISDCISFISLVIIIISVSIVRPSSVLASLKSFTSHFSVCFLCLAEYYVFSYTLFQGLYIYPNPQVKTTSIVKSIDTSLSLRLWRTLGFSDILYVVVHLINPLIVSRISSLVHHSQSSQQVSPLQPDTH